MKKLLVLILSAIMVSGLVLSGCGKANTGGEAASAPKQDADAGTAAVQEETTEEETTVNSVHEIEGWPADVPAPDFGGTLDARNPGKDSLDLTFRDIDPAKAAQYVQKLKDAGFTSWLREEDKPMNTTAQLVDKNGETAIHHIIYAAKGEPVYNEMLGRELIEDGYYIHMVYTDVDEYTIEGGFQSTPKVELYLSWENPLVYQ